MNFKTRKSLISILCAYVVCLIASTATIVVFVEEPFFEEPYWGNLKAGDEMRWKFYEPKNLYYELKILELQGEGLKVYYHEYKVEPHGEIETIERGTVNLTEVSPFIYPASKIHNPVTIYMYKGLIYLAEYYGSFDVHSMYTGKSYDKENWCEYSTGILFETRRSASGSLTYHCVLEHTTAKLIINGMVPGFPMLFLKASLNWFFFQHGEIQVIRVIIVALVSVAMISLYMTARHHKKKNT